MRILPPLLLLLLPVSIAVADPSISHEEKIKKHLQPYLDAEIFNAVSIGVIHRDRTWIGHFGKLSDEQPSPPNGRSIYEIGSVSKVFTGLLLANAVQSGQLKLDQPIASLMKELRETNQQVGQSITLLHLATHNSGLPRMPDNWNPADINNPYADYRREQLTAFMANVKPANKPNEATLYSNVGFGLLGDLLSAKSGTSYEQVLKQTVSGPLHMRDTTITLDEGQRRRVAPPHNLALQRENMWEFDALVGAGGIRSTVPDMLKFIKANLQPPDTELGKAIDLAWQQHVAPRGGQFAMGLGWHIARDGSTRWHNGQTGGYHSAVFISRPLKSGVVVLSNTATGQVDRLAESIIQILAGMDVRPPDFDEGKKIDIKTMKRLVGKYTLFPNFVLTVSLQGDRLIVQATNQPALRVYPESETRWKYREVEAEIRFELPDQGPAESLTLHQNGRQIRGPRAKD